MEKKELEINGNKIVIMEQPASFMISLDKKYGDFDKIGYAQEILKYPSGINPKLEEIINIPSEIKYDNLVFKLSENKKNALYQMASLFEVVKNKGDFNYVLVAEQFLKSINKNVDEFKYKYLQELGLEVLNQVKEYIYVLNIVNNFRSF